MAFQFEFSAETERDFGLIFDHLPKSYIRFVESAIEQAEARVLEISDFRS